MGNIREAFIENEIITAITKMIDNPKENGIYLDHKCTAELMIIFDKYWTKELLDKDYALRAMRCLNKAALNNLKSRDADMKTLKRNIRHLEGINKDLVKTFEALKE